MEEQWRTVVYDGVVYDNYEVSNFGRVRSLDRVVKRTRCGVSSDFKAKGKILTPGDNGNGYLFLYLYKDGNSKHMYIHRMVAFTFIPNPNNLPQVNHKDENPSNNHVDNLEWCDAEYNSNYGSHNEKVRESAKKRELTEERRQILKENSMKKRRKIICVETEQIFDSVKEAEEWCHGHVAQCLRGRTKTAGGYHWMYYDEFLESRES